MAKPREASPIAVSPDVSKEKEKDKKQKLKDRSPAESSSPEAGVVFRPKKDKPPQLELRSSAISENDEFPESPMFKNGPVLSHQTELRRKSAFLDFSDEEEDNHKKLLKKIKVAFKKVEGTIAPAAAPEDQKKSSRMKRPEWKSTLPIDFGEGVKDKKEHQAFLKYLQSADKEGLERMKKSVVRLDRLKGASDSLPLCSSDRVSDECF